MAAGIIVSKDIHRTTFNSIMPSFQKNVFNMCTTILWTQSTIGLNALYHLRVWKKSQDNICHGAYF